MSKKEYIQTNKEWLETKAKEEGVKPLPKGIYYKVINEGKDDGKHPSPRSIVTAHYTGWTINGKKFDTSRGGTPIAFRLNELIEGWIIAMQQMCIGDKWEIYIPAEMGYGKFSQPGIPGGSNTHLRDRTFRNCIKQERLHIHSKKCFILLIFNIIHSFMSRFFRYLYK